LFNFVKFLKICFYFIHCSTFFKLFGLLHFTTLWFGLMYLWPTYEINANTLFATFLWGKALLSTMLFEMFLLSLLERLGFIFELTHVFLSFFFQSSQRQVNIILTLNAVCTFVNVIISNLTWMDLI
jgi:hypothetical protein